MRRYYVVRVGSNAANQGMTPEVVVGSIRTRRTIKACRHVDAINAWHEENPSVTVYNNQYLALRPVSSYSASNRDGIEESPDMLESREVDL